MKYTKELLQQAVAESISIMGVLRQLNVKLTGGMHYHISTRIKKFKIDTSHFKGQGYAKGRIFTNRRKAAKDILIIRQKGSAKEKTYLLVRALLEIGRLYKCDICNNEGIQNDKKLILHVDHIDGNNLNNLPENLRFLCPNCHSQTDTYGIKNSPICGGVKKEKIHRNTNNKKKHKSRQKKITLCPICGIIKKNRNKYCSYNCSAISQQKIEWNNIDIIKILENTKKKNGKYNLVAASKLLGISDNGLKKKLKQLAILS